MPKPTKGARLGGSASHQKAILANLATALFEHGRITTTESKAKRLRPFAEKIVTHAKHGDLAHRREVMKIIRDKDVVHTLFAEIGPHFATREGGYTRIVKTLNRKGDNAPMAVIELVKEHTATSEADRARRVAASQVAAPAAEIVEADATEAAVDTDAAVENTDVVIEAAQDQPAAEPAAAAETAGDETAAAETAGDEPAVSEQEK